MKQYINGVLLFLCLSLVGLVVPAITLFSSIHYHRFMFNRMLYHIIRVRIHQPASSYIGPELGVLYIEGDELKNRYKNVLTIYKQTTVKSLHVLYVDMLKDSFMSPAEAQIHGIVDFIGLDSFEDAFFKDRLCRTDLDPNAVWELIP